MAPTIKVQQIILPNVVDDVTSSACRRWIGARPADRQEGLREIPAAVHHPSRSRLSRRQLVAPDRQGRLHGLPRAWDVGELRDAAMPSNEKQKEEWEKKYHWSSRTSGTTRCCR
jgi:hypothetical protein